MRALAIYTESGFALAPLALATEGTFERVQGWLKRESTSPGEGLLITPCASLHTIGMKFELDIVFLDRKGKVLKLVAGVKPGRLVWGPWRGLLFPWLVRALELPGGTLAGMGQDLRPGQSLRFGPRQA
ncbi:MAG: DUF192 domain-containing protein [bacterium]